MSAQRVALAVLLGLLLWVAPAATLATEAPLQLDEVLRSLEGTHPGLESRRRVVERRDAEVLAAKGAFDPVVSIRGKWAPIGYYPQVQVDTMVRQPTPLWGLSVYAGHRLGWGSYPVYKGELRTLSGGEVRAGLSLPLWRNRSIDAARAERQRAEIRRRGAEHGADAAALAVERDATKAYWSWVAAGQRLEVARELLEIATSRQEALEAQVAAGASPQIVLADNRRLVLDRQAKVVDATRRLEQAAVALSLFLRDGEQRPVRPSADRLPPSMPEPGPLPLASVEHAVERAHEHRPDAHALMAEREAAHVDVRLARNQRAPSVELQAFVAKDIGAGPVELAPVEAGLGATVEVPIPMRAARGRHRAAKAELDRVDAERRALRDAIEAEVRGAWVAAEAALVRVVLAREQRELAVALADAEVKRLGLGSSDLLAVNLREQAAADAATSEIDALTDAHHSHADLVAAVGGRPDGR